MITYFKSINDTSSPYHVDVSVAISRIRDGKSMQLVTDVRFETDKNKRNEKKKLLPAICFSGQFSKRADTACINHSGLICIDFDGFDDDVHLSDFRKKVESDDYTYACFLSPSGDGLKVLVRIPKNPMHHKHYFNALKTYYNIPQFDTTSRNISRVCYESYDPDIYVNELSSIWTQIEGDVEVPVERKPVMFVVEDHQEIVRRLNLWWNKNHGMVPGQRNNNLFILASALNEYGINKEDAMAVLHEHDVDGSMSREIPTIIYSAYKNVQQFNTKYFEDKEKETSIKNDIKMGIPVEQVVDKYAISTDQVPDSDEDFWTKSSKGKIDLVPHLFRRFLERSGFYKYYPPTSMNFVFVRVVDNTISDVNEDVIKDFVLKYLYDRNDMSVYNFFAINTKFFQETFLNYVSKIDADFIKDTPDVAYLYYLNCAVRVSKSSIDMIDYKDLSGYVWEKQKIQRNFNISSFDDCEYKRFINNIAGDTPDRQRSVESTIGYLMHSHKPASYAPAIILNDEVISDNPEGGTGKGIFVKSISHMKKMVIIDGKGFSFQKSFPYQRVQVDTQVLVFDDVARHFDFERLFSVITEGITLEKKNKDEIKLEFEDSPKIVITTNYAIRGAGNSFERRKWDLEFKQHYSKNYTPESEFGHMLFTDWNDDEWIRFDNYMISNLQLYLNKGLMQSEFKNLKTRKFIAETSADFWEWCTSKDNMGTKANMPTLGNTLYNSFVSEYPDFGNYGRYKISQIKFYRWLDSFGEYQYGMKPEITRGANGKNVEFKIKQNEQSRLNF